MAEDKAISIHKFRNPEQALLMLEETGLYQDFMSADSEELRYNIFKNAEEIYEKGIFEAGGSLDDADTPKIYVADLKAYNEGKLIGEWIDLSEYNDGIEVQNKIDDLMEEYSKKHHDGDETEHAIHDYENFHSSLYSEYMGEDDYDTIIQSYRISEERDIPPKVLQAIVNDYSPDDLEEWVDDRYYGEFADDTELAEEYVESVGMEGISNVDFYFDYDKFGRDLAMDYTEYDGHYFTNYKKGGEIKKYDLSKYAKGGEIGDKVIVETDTKSLWRGKKLKGEIVSLRPFKIRTGPTSTSVIPDRLIKSVKPYAKGGYVDGDIVRISQDNDNDNYDLYRNKDLEIIGVSHNTNDHPGYDESMSGMALYDLRVVDSGEDVPFSLYEYEVQGPSNYAKGGKIMKTYDDFGRDYDEFTNYVMDRIDLDERKKIRDDWNKKSRENRAKGIKGGKEMRWENYLLKRVNEKSYAKGGEIKPIEFTTQRGDREFYETYDRPSKDVKYGENEKDLIEEYYGEVLYEDDMGWWIDDDTVVTNVMRKEYAKGGTTMYDQRVLENLDDEDYYNTIYVMGEYPNGDEFYENQETTDKEYVINDWKKNDRGLKKYKIVLEFEDGTIYNLVDNYAKGGKISKNDKGIFTKHAKVYLKQFYDDDDIPNIIETDYLPNLKKIDEKTYSVEYPGGAGYFVKEEFELTKRSLKMKNTYSKSAKGKSDWKIMENFEKGGKITESNLKKYLNKMSENKFYDTYEEMFDEDWEDENDSRKEATKTILDYLFSLDDEMRKEEMVRIGYLEEPTEYAKGGMTEKDRLEEAIKHFEDKIKKQGRITNARDEEQLYKLKQYRKEYFVQGGDEIEDERDIIGMEDYAKGGKISPKDQYITIRIDEVDRLRALKVNQQPNVYIIDERKKDGFVDFLIQRDGEEFLVKNLIDNDIPYNTIRFKSDDPSVFNFKSPSYAKGGLTKSKWEKASVKDKKKALKSFSSKYVDYDWNALPDNVKEMVSTGKITDYYGTGYAKGGKVKSNNNEMIIGGLAGILFGFFLNR